jgi:hypothetical protein
MSEVPLQLKFQKTRWEEVEHLFTLGAILSGDLALGTIRCREALYCSEHGGALSVRVVRRSNSVVARHEERRN